jgi:hypothetical protein
MKPLKGLYTDVHPIDQPQGTYPYARNMVNSHNMTALENEPGFLQYNSIVPGTHILGIVPMGADFALFSHNINTGVGYIGYVSINGLVLTYTSVYTSVGLDFNPEARIKGEYQINAKNQRLVAWIEINGTNPPRIANFDDPNIDSIEDLELFPQYTGATVTTTVNDTGGALLTAAYLPIYKWKRTDLTETDWIVAPLPVYVVDEPLADAPNEIDGAPAGTPTGKSITVTFANADTTYDKLVIGYIRRKGGITQAFNVSEIILSTNMTYTITGTETTTDISLDEILTPNANYNNAQAITQLNNQLILANLTADDILDLQAVANKVIIDYSCVTSNTAQDSRSRSGSLGGTFQPGEVYAFYLVGELNKGGLVAYHIPGRGPAAGETDTTTTEVSGLSAKMFQVADTSVATGRVNRMGYWENSSELYPSTFPVGLSATGADEALASQKVRHHKFPDTATLLERHGGMVGEGAAIDSSSVYELKVNVSNVIIPEELQASLRGWKIAYAKRTYQNSLVLAADLLHLAASYSDNPDIIWSTGGNWNTDTRNASGDGGWQDMTIWHNAGNDTITKVQRGHSLDLLYDRPGVIPSYVEFACKLKSPKMNTKYTGFGSEGGYIHMTGEGDGQNPSVVVDYAKSNAYRQKITGVRKRKISNFQYIPQNTVIGNISTKKSEEIIYMEIDQLKATIESHGSTGLLDFPSTNTPDIPLLNIVSSNEGALIPFAGSVAGCDYEATYYMYYKQILSDLYVSYTNQPLVLTSGRNNADGTTLSNLTGGDVHSALCSYITTSVQSPTVEDSENAHIEGPRMFKYYLSECRHNWNYRHEASTATEDWYAPKTDPRDFWVPRASADPAIPSSGLTVLDTVSTKLNKLSYNTDYDMVNEFVPAVIVDDIANFSTSAPTAIIYSPIQNGDSLESAWGTFPANNRYVQPKNRGSITNLQGYKNKDLLIHHRDSLYATRSNISLNTDTSDVKLSSAWIFDMAPEEVLSTDQGYAGTRHPLACKLTKLGYTFPSDKQGKIFTYDGQLKELSAEGMRNFFRGYGEADNSYIDDTTVVTGDLLPVPAFGVNEALWEEHGEVYETSWNVTEAGASISVISPPSGAIMKNLVQPVTVIEDTTVNVTLTYEIGTGFVTTTTFTLVFLDADDEVLATRTLGVITYPQSRTFTLNNVVVPPGAVKVGFKLSFGSFGGTGFLNVTNFKVVGDKVYSSSFIPEISSTGYQLEYDEKFNRLIVSKTSTESDWTLSYNPANQLWTSFHDYYPETIFGLQNKLLISSQGTDFFLHNVGPYGVYYDDEVTLPSLIDVCLNPEPTKEKVLASIGWQTIVENAGDVLWDKTLTHVTISTPFRCTGRKDVQRLTTLTGFNNANTRVYDHCWTYNDIYDVSTAPNVRKGWIDGHDLDLTKLNSNMPWYKRRKFIGKYVICRLEYSNAENNLLSLLDVSADFRPSQR